jgi:hypothetical protein
MLTVKITLYCFTHKVLLQYKIIPASNTCNIFPFPGAIKQMEAIKSFGSLLASLKSLLYPTDIPVF